MRKVVAILLLLMMSACSKEDNLMEINLEGLDGEAYTVSDLLGENGTILYLSGTWVSPNDTLTYLNEQQQHFNDDGIAVYFINTTDESRKKIDDFIDRSNISFDYYIDVNEKLTKKYEITTLPTTIFIDAYGNMETIHAKDVKPEVLESITSKWLAS